MLYSSAAYCAPKKVAAWELTDFCEAISPFRLNRTFSIEDSWPVLGLLNSGFAYVGVDDSRRWVVAAFKGSNGTIDWLHDFWGLEFATATCHLSNNKTNITVAGKVHMGFCRYYAALARMGIAEAFIGLLAANPGYTPVVTGHSLGATAAMLLAYEAYERSAGAVRPVLLTFGQPRSGDYNFSAAVKARVRSAFRVVHRNDIVPHVPMCIGEGACDEHDGWPHHFGPEVWYTGNVSVGAPHVLCDPSGEDMNCSNSVGMTHFSALDHCYYFGRVCGGCCRVLEST